MRKSFLKRSLYINFWIFQVLKITKSCQVYEILYLHEIVQFGYGTAHGTVDCSCTAKVESLAMPLSLTWLCIRHSNFQNFFSCIISVNDKIVTTIAIIFVLHQLNFKCVGCQKSKQKFLLQIELTHVHARTRAVVIAHHALYLRFRIDLHADRRIWNACQYKNHCRNWVYNWATCRATTGSFLNPTTFPFNYLR